MSTEGKTVKIGKWKIPSKLFDDYVRFSIMANTYLDPDSKVPSVVPSVAQYERSMRWNLCVQQLMKIHREVCTLLNIEYSENLDDEFYSLFHKEVNKQTELKG